LSEYSEGKKVQDIVKDLESEGVECSIQQIRNWLMGETIRPNDINVIGAIAKVSGNMKLLSEMTVIYDAGGRVQEYHRKAGRWLSNELKNRSKEIEAIYTSGNTLGRVTGIGDVRLYTVEEILPKEFVSRNRINTMEAYE